MGEVDDIHQGSLPGNAVVHFAVEASAVLAEAAKQH